MRSRLEFDILILFFQTEDQIVLMQRRGLHLMAITMCFYFIDADNRISLPNGKKVEFSNEREENVEDIVRRLVETAERFRGISLDRYQLVCLKGIMLLNPGLCFEKPEFNCEFVKVTLALIKSQEVFCSHF